MLLQNEIILICLMVYIFCFGWTRKYTLVEQEKFVESSKNLSLRTTTKTLYSPLIIMQHTVCAPNGFNLSLTVSRHIFIPRKNNFDEFVHFFYLKTVCTRCCVWCGTWLHLATTLIRRSCRSWCLPSSPSWTAVGICHTQKHTSKNLMVSYQKLKRYLKLIFTFWSYGLEFSKN